MTSLISRITGTAFAAMLVVVATTHAATAETVGDGCGTTTSTSCSSTTHFAAMDQWLGGGAADASCPDYINNDWGHEVGTGNGIFHININKDGEEWLTNTWTGDVTITFYNPSNINVVTDGDGNVVSATPTGPAEHVLTGRSTTWFGASFNNRNSTLGFTFSFDGTDEVGNIVKVHDESSSNWTPGSNPNAAPSHAHENFRCS